MIKCSPEAFARCQSKCYHCGTEDKAFFLEGSDCDKFNQEVLAAPKTNGDRIRAMSDEELAECLYHGFDINYCTIGPQCEERLETGRGVPAEWCKGCIMKWLKQPAEGE